MTFILKLVVLLIVFSFVVYVLKAISRFSANLRRIKNEVQQMRNPSARGGAVSAEMVRCATCGTFVSASDAVQLRIRKRAQTFCSEDCMQKQSVHG
ncbi:MAG: hypothetical protein KF868_17185 [Acidobacteria bacterium]|nr:hypothetical protein [Acidobacteriota bacterium]MCW5967349.1 hypothetical protein [Blastocatellales bacterium]